MLGNDIRKASPEIMEILLNREVIAVNQDPLGKQGVKVRDDGDLEVWSKMLHNGSRAVILFNRSDMEVNMGVLWTEIGYPEHLSAKIRDLWQKKDVGSTSGAYAADVPSHGVVMITIDPQ